MVSARAPPTLVGCADPTMTSCVAPTVTVCAPSTWRAMPPSTSCASFTATLVIALPPTLTACVLAAWIHISCLPASSLMRISLLVPSCGEVSERNAVTAFCSGSA
ncbi:MAG: hypothetical protein WKG00_23295 [Polyangiaceae bacterium]